MAVDFNVQEPLLRQGHRMYQSARARAAHQSYEHFGGLLGANYVYARLLGANRARSQSWSAPKRLLAGLLAPVAVPLMRIARLARSLRGRPALWGTFLQALPVTYLIYLAAAGGEGLGYLLGKGKTEEQFVSFELQLDRSRRSS